MKIIIDTNFLLLPGNFKIDIIQAIADLVDFDYNLCIIDKTIQELRKITQSGSGKDKLAANIALELINKDLFTILPTTEDKIVDDLILDIAKNEKIVVCTMDKGLKTLLKSLKTTIITMRSQKHLILE